MTLEFRYHVPHSVRQHIDYITPGVTLREVSGVDKAGKNKVHKRGQHGLPPPILEPILEPIEELLESLGEKCDKYITPQCIKSKGLHDIRIVPLYLPLSPGLYNITDGKTATKGNELGIFESIGDIYAQEDLDWFFKVLAP